jgi:hypothetical protein
MDAFDVGVISGMEKWAATMSQIRAAAERIGHVVARKGSMAESFGALLVPTKRHHSQGVRHHIQAIHSAQKKMLPPGVPEFLEKKMRPLYESKKMRGKILMSKGAPQTLDPTAGKARGKNIRAVVNVHEGFERTPHPRVGSLHISPEVLAKEHNLLSRLTGKGASKVRRSMMPIRAREYAHLRSQLTSSFGPRAKEFMGPGKKIPKAMRKALRRKNVGMSSQRARNIMASQRKTLAMKKELAG